MCEVPESVVSPSIAIFAMASAVTEVIGKEDPNLHSGISKNHMGTIGPGNVSIDFGDSTTTRIARGELDLSVLQSDQANLDSKMLVAIERAAYEKLEFPRTYGKGALPLKPQKSEEVRGMEKTELLTFTSLSPNDIDRVTQLTSFERLLNGAYKDIVGANDIEPWVLTNRSLFEEFSPQVLSQVLSKSMISDPEVLCTYHPPSDSLLMALHNPTARGRAGQKFWKPAKQVRHRPPFNEWRLSPRLDATPRTLEAARTGIDLESIYLKRLTTHAMHLFPADHSNICLRTMASELAEAIDDGVTIPRDVVGGKLNSWLSVYHEGNVFGLRHSVGESTMIPGGIERNGGRAGGKERRGSRGSAERRGSRGSAERRGSRGSVEEDEVEGFLRDEKHRRQRYRETGKFAAHYVCDFDDGVRMQACEGNLQMSKPDGFHSITLRQTFPSGLVVSNCSDGSVRQEVITSAKVGVFGDEAKDELCRLIFGKGTVVRHLRNGSTHILYSDGSSAMRSKAGEVFLYTSPKDGCMYRRVKDENQRDDRWSKVGSSANFAKELDPETKAKITTVEFEDRSRTRIVENTDGSLLVVHSDGTVVRSAPKIEDEDGVLFVPKVLVEAKGFAAVEIDVEVDQQAKNYAAGGQVAISKGGDRVRSRTAFPDGTYCLSTFDTRITSPVCGRIIAVRPDKSEIVASDDGMVMHKVRSLWGGNDSFECEMIRLQGGQKPTANDVNKSKGGASYNIKDDPDAQPDPDTETRCYIFSLTEGKMRTCDNEHNIFEAWLGSVTKSGCVNVELAGVLSTEDTNEGMTKVPAVVNEPIEPRMFVVRRDGSGFEILRNYDIEDWENRVKNEEKIRDLTASEENGKIQRFGDPQDVGSCEREFELRYKYLSSSDWKGEGRLHDFATTFAKIIGAYWSKYSTVPQWMISSLPAAAKYSKMLKAGSKGKDDRGGAAVVGFDECESGSILDWCPEIVITRTWVVHQPLSTQEKRELMAAIEECERWRMDRQNTIERFSVEDDRDIHMLKAEQNMTKLLKRAYRSAKAAKKRQRETILRKKQQQQRQEQQDFFQRSQQPGAADVAISAPAIQEEEEEDDDDDDEDWDDDDFDEEGKQFVEESDANFTDAKEVFTSMAGDGIDSDGDDNDGVAGARGEVTANFDQCRAALVQILGFGVDKAMLQDKLKAALDLDAPSDGSAYDVKISFSHFFMVLNNIKSEVEMKEAAIAEGVITNGDNDNDGGGGGEEKKESSDFDLASLAAEGGATVSNHGAYFKTAEGMQLRKKSIADKTYFPKKKGDIRLLSAEPIPQPAVCIRPKTAPGGPSNVAAVVGGGGGGGAAPLKSSFPFFEDEGGLLGGDAVGEKDSIGDDLNLGIGTGVVRNVRTAPTLGGAGSIGGTSRGSSPSASMSIKELRAVAATGSGRNAVRAQSLIDKEEGVRLRSGERPADKTIHGVDRDRPVRVVDRARGVTNQQYQRLDKRSASGRNTPDVSLRSLSPSPPPIITTSNTMEVIPECINFGICKVGQVLGANISVNNVGTDSVRYTFSVRGGGQGSSIEVAQMPRGVVAAGIRENVVVKVTCNSRCEIKGQLVVTSQFQVAEVRLIGNVVAEEEYDAGVKKRSKQVFNWKEE